MKVILLFALCGLSFYQVSGHHDCPEPPVIYKPCKVPPVNNAYKNSKTCLAQALEDSAEFLREIGKFLCAYNDCKKGGDYNHFKAAVSELTHVLTCLGCHLDVVLGTENALEKLLNEVGGVVTGEVGEIAEKLVGSLGILQPVIDILCTLVGKVLESQCLQDALKKTLPGAINELTGVLCGKPGSAAYKAANAIKTALKQGGCVLDDGLGTGDTLEELLEELGEHLKPLVGNILQLTGKVPLISDVLCLLLNGGLLNKLLGTGGILSVLA